jgi:hypothetical protein
MISRVAPSGRMPAKKPRHSLRLNRFFLKLIFYTMLAEVVHFQQVAILKTA